MNTIYASALVLTALLTSLTDGLRTAGDPGADISQHQIILSGEQSANLQTLNFDDIPTSAGIANLPTSYNHLTFTSFNAFAPKDPALENWIAPNDHNCAISSPNAIIGSQSSNGEYPSFGISPAGKGDSSSSPRSFTLHSLTMKPMESPPPGTTIYIRGYPVGVSSSISSSLQAKVKLGKASKQQSAREPMLWHVDFVSDYHLPFEVKVAEYSRKRWDGLERVVIWAEFGEGKLDWEFCLDDVVLEWEWEKKDSSSMLG
ncbi:hypothetical protein MMC25_004481 [Agyrium rufum]|nr:hypothetical protein [Agyrium rufum]